MTKLAAIVAPALALLAAAPPVMSADLTLLRSFEYAGPSGLSYDSRYCGIWVASESRDVRLITPWGDEIMGFEAGLSRVDAIAMDGDALVLSDGNGLYQRVDRSGAALGETFRLAGILTDTDGLYVDPASGDYWVADDGIAELVRVSAAGAVTRRVDGASQSAPLMEPQGITRDPRSGHFLVVDDADASDSLFEFDAQGRLLDVIPLGGGGYDAEGITVQPDTGTVFIAYDDGDRIAAFSYVPTGDDDIGPLAAASAEPGGCVLSGLPGRGAARHG
ncbi:NHL repeat-containing protein [Mangrovicoccus algicola]|uniref:SMP-30/Gluconolactonase/LRE-like region domain-containing protein n=1 Tax=Mangrovicoccus algicola TaxID=2771008 RepID=A0A8J6Z096_9RHOB|nr:hypothetical protein [Mangrovicoccus algicola]MBE3639173.1 hypothetical protein [Mangrovicoccus algicola]